MWLIKNLAKQAFEREKFNAEERHKGSESNRAIDTTLLTQDRLQEASAKTRADLAKYRAKTTALSDALRKIEGIKATVGVNNTSAKNELDNIETGIKVKQLEEAQKLNNSLIDYRKAEIVNARANAAAHQEIADTGARHLADEEAAGYIPAEAAAKQAYAGINAEGVPLRRKGMSSGDYQNLLYAGVYRGDYTLGQAAKAFHRGEFVPEAP